jgi:hypothetical protein
MRLPDTWNRLHWLELAALHEKIEEARVSFEPAMFNSLYQHFQFLALRFREQSDGGTFDRGVAGLHDSFLRQRGNEAYALGSFNIEMPPKSSRKVENFDVVEINAITAEDGVQASDVSSLGLS